MFREELLSDNSDLISTIAALCKPHALLADLGYAACVSPARLKEVLSQFPALSERDVVSFQFLTFNELYNSSFSLLCQAEILCMMLRTHSEPADESMMPLVSALSMVVSDKWDNLASASPPVAGDVETALPEGWALDTLVATLNQTVRVPFALLK